MKQYKVNQRGVCQNPDVFLLAGTRQPGQDYIIVTTAQSGIWWDYGFSYRIAHGGRSVGIISGRARYGNQADALSAGWLHLRSILTSPLVVMYRDRTDALIFQADATLQSFSLTNQPQHA